ncbi:MAG: hypothetical protein WCK89_24225, partial [bacterium]
LVLRDLDVLAGDNAQIGVTVTTLDQRLADLWEPGASSVEQRFGVIAEARRAGLTTAIMFGPLLPGLSDDQKSLDAMFRRAADAAIDLIWTDALNPRPKVWPAVASLLREQFPHLLDSYRRILFDRHARETYLGELRERVILAADRWKVRERLSVCQ